MPTEKIIVILLILSTSCCLDNSGVSKDIRVMSWNLQNLFDDKDDGYEYSDYSGSEGNWSSEYYNKRLKLISKIIKLNNSDIVALQEIEGLSVLQDLCNNYLEEYNYFVATDTSSIIEIGFISKYPIISVTELDPGNGLRRILEVTVRIDGKELVVINNHWKSKLGGYTENLRLKSSFILQKRLKEIEDRNVIILGDFNESYNESEKVKYPTALTLNRNEGGLYITGSNNPKTEEFFSPWIDSEYEGSYLYKNQWETIDNFFLNSGTFNNRDFIYKAFTVDNSSELFNKDGSIKKWNTEFNTGYSDHLPIIINFSREDIVTTLE